jgi:hypothetical protein
MYFKFKKLVHILLHLGKTKALIQFSCNFIKFHYYNMPRLS